MSKSITITRSTSIPKDIEGCKLLPLNKGKESFSKVAKHIIEGTYYRINIDEPETLRCMVTVMPDGTKIAWDSCSKCHSHVANCSCLTGMYHPPSIAFIRKTYDSGHVPNTPTDYSMYYNPTNRVIGETPNTGVIPPKSVTPVKAKIVESEVSISDIENLDLSALGKRASKDAKTTIKRTRNVLKGK
jgi:hypothetical protein